MKLGHIELFVRDPLKSKDFYTNVLGCELVDVQGDKFVWVKFGEREILLRRGDNASRAENYQRAAVGFVLYTDNMAREVQRLESRGLRFSGDDGGCPTFTDPDGHWFQLADPDH